MGGRPACPDKGASTEMLSHRKPLAALAAVTVALAVAVPAASASAAPTVDPTVCQLLNTTRGPYGPTQGLGGSALSSVLANAGGTVGCAAPAGPSSQPSLPGPFQLPFGFFR